MIQFQSHDTNPIAFVRCGDKHEKEVDLVEDTANDSIPE